MDKQLYYSVLRRLAVDVPLFAEAMLNKALTNIGTDKSKVTAFQMKKAIEKYIEPTIRDNLHLKKGLQELGAGYITLDKHGHIISVSKAIHRLFPDFSKHKFTIEKDITVNIISSENKQIKVLIVPIIDKHSALEGAIAIIYDITLEIELDREMTITYNKLYESEKKFRLVNENIPVVVYSKLPDKYSTTTFMTGKVEALLGYKKEDLLNDKELWIKIIHPDDTAYVLQKIKEHRENKIPLDIEYRIITKNNDVKWIHDKATILFDEDNNIATINGFLEDITKRKEFQEQYNKQLLEQAMILDSIQAMVFFKDTENNMTKVNRIFADIMGLPKEQIEGKSCTLLWPPELAEKYFSDDKEILKSGKSKFGIIESLITSTGDKRWLKTDKIINYDKGKITGIIGFAVDITDLRNAEEMLKKRNEELERFNKVTMGREMKIIELKNRIKELEAK